MRPDRLSHRPGKVLVRATVTAIVLASLAALAYAAVTTISEKTKADRTARFAKLLTSRTVSDIDDLTALLRSQQALYLPISLPTLNFLLRQSCGTVPFDPKNFPDDFMKGLIEETDKGCPVYRLVIAEDPITRETVFANAKGYEIHAIPAAKDYDPWWFLELLYPDLSTGDYSDDQVKMLQQWYDPAHIQVTVTLLPVEYIDAYVTEVANAISTLPSGGGTPMMRYSGPPVTNLQLTAIETKTNGMLLTLAYPTNFTNRVDIFTCTNLVGAYWDLAATVSVDTSTNWIEWLDTSPPGVRLYTAGNADVDTDHDGLTDAREKFMYHTSPATNDTDGDGLTDSNEVFNLHTDPNNGNTNSPTVWIVFPSNNYSKVWLP